MSTLEFEHKQLDYAAMLGELHNLDCTVCPFLKVKGGHGHIVIHCHHPALSVPVRLKGQLDEVLRWCPRRKMLEEKIMDRPRNGN